MGTEDKWIRSSPSFLMKLVVGSGLTTTFARRLFSIVRWHQDGLSRCSSCRGGQSKLCRKGRGRKGSHQSNQPCSGYRPATLERSGQVSEMKGRCADGKGLGGGGLLLGMHSNHLLPSLCRNHCKDQKRVVEPKIVGRVPLASGRPCMDI